MNFFTMVPWVHFFFSEATIMDVRPLYRNDGAKRFSEVEGGLNKIGVRGLRGLLRKLRLEIEYFDLRPVKGLKALTRVPLGERIVYRPDCCRREEEPWLACRPPARRGMIGTGARLPDGAGEDRI
jgi:hypothetical protein